MKCSFCEDDMETGRGFTYVKKDGKIFYFCSAKCRINMLTLGRKSKDVKWTLTAQKAKVSGKKE